MAISVAVTPGKQFASTETVDNAKLNQLGQPTFVVTGTISAGDVADGTITAAKTKADIHSYAGNSVHTASAGFDIYTVTFGGAPNPTAPASLVNGLEVWFKADADNNQANGVQINVNGLGNVVAYKFTNQILVKGDIINGQIIGIRYSSAITGPGTAGWEIISPLAFPDILRGTGVTAGSSTAMTLTVVPPVAANSIALADLNGREIICTAGIVSGAAPTLTLTVGTTVLAAKPIMKFGTQSVAAGDIIVNQKLLLSYETLTDTFQMLNPPASLTLAALVGDARNLISTCPSSSSVAISADAVILANATNTQFYLAQSAAIGTTTITISSSNGVNSIDAGGTMPTNLQANWYFYYLISDGSQVKGIISLNSSAPALPSGYVYYALIGAIYNATAGAFTLNTDHYQLGRRIMTGQAATGQIVSAIGSTGAVLNVVAGAELTAFKNRVPPIAKTWIGVAGSIKANEGIWYLAADAANTGIGFVEISGNTADATRPSVVTSHVWGGSFELPIRQTTPQLFSYMFNTTGTVCGSLWCNGFTI